MLKPLGPRVLIKQDRLEEIDPAYKAAKNAGIEIPREFQEVRREQDGVVIGTVVALGSMAFDPPVGTGVKWCEIGDRVYFAKYAGKVITDPETKEEFVLLNDEDIVTLVTGEKND